MTLTPLKTLFLATTLAGTLTVGAAAQERDGSWWPRWGMGQGMMGGGGSWGPMMGYNADAMLDRIDGRLAFLKTELKITPAQEQAWNDLATVIRDTSETHNKMMREMMKEVHDGSFFERPLPERLQLQESHMAARLEQIRNVKAAVEKLYTQLDETQKKAADDIVLPMMGMGMGRSMGRGMMFNE
jgi:hypothetical protein